ncbi:hypothetical protein HAZT_HAZT003629 [Hyalella azteca]|uniref:Glycosyltransferase family 92 protein n=1 Tax=Hyalella azteca TaxID=294128 RepID=A0A6A0GV23_HYAAZ|nr:hypothetical protein HAZT_HAZT003629 [Hyalella azteca]
MVLRSIPWNDVKIRVIAIEIIWASEGPEGIKKFMEARGFEFIRQLDFDYLFFNKKLSDGLNREFKDEAGPYIEVESVQALLRVAVMVLRLVRSFQVQSYACEYAKILQSEIPNLPIRYWQSLNNKFPAKNATCAIFPSLIDLQFNNVYWQTLKTSNGTFHLYGAYYDNRTLLAMEPVVRMLGDFAVCVKGLDFPKEDLSVRLVEWFETLRHLGAEKIFLYELEVHPNITKVLNYYKKLGGGCLSYPVDTDEAQLQHYRADCVAELRSKCDGFKNFNVRDDAILRHKDPIISRVIDSLSALGFF